ncbi:MAG: hypothetical protein GX443_07125 [Deltaproteobacteria bacterium]|nr:hypothetical protein [Deltaproteobacteria bacterium]
MCDLFALSAGRQYSAPEALTVFAERAKKNMDGWGIGYFRKDRACVEKSFEQAYADGRIHDSFARLSRVVNSRLIIAHVRFRTSGFIDECHAHPFILHFAGRDWLFAHNGKAPGIETYLARGDGIQCAFSDSARTFEFLRDQLMTDYVPLGTKASLLDALLSATSRLVEEYPGSYNYLLSNGTVLFAFSNHRQFMILRGDERNGGALLLTTVEKGLSNGNWVRIARSTSSRGVLLAVAGGDLVMQRSLL